MNNLQIKGVTSTGNPEDIVRKIGELIDEPVSEEDIDTCQRVPTRTSNETNIIVRFVRRDNRHAFLSKARKHKISNDKLFSCKEGPVFANEHLTQTNEKLLGAVIARKKQVGWKVV